MALNLLPLELIDLILFYAVPKHWNKYSAADSVDPSFHVDFGEPDTLTPKYHSRRFLAMRLVSKQFCKAMSRKLLQKANGKALRKDMRTMNIDGLTMFCLAKYDLGPKHRTRPFRRAAASARSLCRWKKARNEGVDEALYLQAAFRAMFANSGYRCLVADARGQSAPVQPAMDEGGDDDELQLLGNGGLSIAACLGDLSTMEALLEMGADPNKPHNLYGSPLYVAACAEQADAMRLLIDAGADLSLSKGAFGLPLEAAARHGCLAAVRFLVEQNAAMGLSLNHALLGGHEAVAAFLLSQVDKVDVNATPDKDLSRTPIWMAIRYGLRDIALQLCTYPDLEPNVQGPDHRTPLYLAVDRHWTDVVQALLSLPQISIMWTDGLGRGPLHVACEKGYDDIVRLLIARDDIEINWSDVDNISPLDYAILKDRHSTVRLLLAHPDTMANHDELQESAPLEAAVGKGDTELFELLLARPEVRASLLDGRLAMTAAAKSGSLPTILRLLDVFSPDMGIDEDGLSLVDTAVVTGHPDIADYLLALPGEDPNSPVGGAAPLCIAALRGRLDVVQYFLARDDVDVNIMSAFGSPLQCAIAGQHTDIVRCLLQRDDVDVNIDTPELNFSDLDFNSHPGNVFDVVEDAYEAPYGYTEYIREDRLGHVLWNFAKAYNSADTKWATPLSNAVRLSSPAILKLLLGHRAIDPNKVDSHGRTPLYYAVKGRTLDCSPETLVRLLMAHPATNRSMGDGYGSVSFE